MTRAAILARNLAGAEAAAVEQVHDVAGNGIILAAQQLLPPLRWLEHPDAERFAHPAERQLARLLTFYGVRWAYEPTTFAVRWGSDGHPDQFVTPDFYLPDHDCYLELTTMRQRLVTRKNRKFRLLRSNYPNVNVRILYLRDFERLQSVYNPDTPAQKPTIGPALFRADEIETRVTEMAAELVLAWHHRPRSERGLRPLLLGVGAGSSTYLSTLSHHIRAMGVAVDHDIVELTTLRANSVGERVRVAKPPRHAVAGRPVTLVQEVLSTGLSAAYLASWLRRHNVASIEMCVLLDRQMARILDLPVAHYGFTAPDVTLAGYGLSRWREYRDLPYIAEVESE